MWKNIVELDRPTNDNWRMRTAFWIPTTTDTLRIFNAYYFLQQQ